MRIVREKLAVINAFLSEHIAGMKVINIFSQEEKVVGHFDHANKDYMYNMIEQMKLYALLTPVVTFFTGISIGFIIFFGGNQVLNKTLTIGFFVAFISYIQWIFKPVREIIEKYNIFLQSATATEKLYKLSLIDLEDDECEKEVFERVEGLVEFKNICFAYIENKSVLKNISFKIKPGERVALVGATGSGKTTILNLINKLYTPTSGSIFIDGKNIKQIDRKNLRTHIGKIDQNVHMFSGTIRENITLGANIPEDTLMRALQISNCDKIIKKFHKGLDYKITESGKNLSFGERQLIAFARLVAYEPSILIMDEATSNIDSDNEKYIIGAISKITQGKTAIIVAHRLSTIKNSDCIYVIDNGEILEFGTHDELLSKKGKYENLYRNMAVSINH